MKKLRILIVDDSAMMRAVIKRALLQTDLEFDAIHEAPNGRRALDVVDHEPVDAIFTDINMPEMNGVEFLRELDRRESCHALRVVVSTDGSSARREEVAGLGVGAYVEKPFAPEVIRGVFDEYLRDQVAG
jgi:two-component system chemotaxis response regulator CheY